MSRRLRQGFIPQVPPQENIRDLVLDQYVKALGKGSASHPAPVADRNVCHGASGDYWATHDTAIDNAKDSCQQNEEKVTYHRGSVNELELSVRKAGRWQQEPERCPRLPRPLPKARHRRLRRRRPPQQPHNYKFGSTLTKRDGWEYAMAPRSKQVDEVSFRRGAKGEGLKSQIDGCGDITSWNLKWMPKDVEFQWCASGQLPTGTKSCIGSALQSAGGSSPGSCTAAGRRSGIATCQPIGIEDWPGYWRRWEARYGDEGRICG
ncbi:hypothetical protein SCUP234_00892 [Seiridium cupressi]